MGVKKACEELLARMKPVREELGNPTWNELTQACYDKLIDLSCKTTYNKNEMVAYTIWGCTAAEVELDLLSGNLQLTRVDILEDCGESMSPGIDLGQVEGAFVMGLGYWLTESLVYGPENGELLTNRTWTYKPPGAKDIPIDFRVTFLRNSSNTGGVLRSKGIANSQHLQFNEPLNFPPFINFSSYWRTSTLHECGCYFCTKARIGIS